MSRFSPTAARLLLALSTVAGTRGLCIGGTASIPATLSLGPGAWQDAHLLGRDKGRSRGHLQARLRMRGGGSGGSSGSGRSGGVVENSDIKSDLIRLDVGGMKCGACAGRVRSLLQAEAGVLDVSVSLPAKMAIVSLDKSRGDVELLQQVLGDKGFPAVRVHPGLSNQQLHADRGFKQSAECHEAWLAVRLVLLLNLPSLVFAVAPTVGNGALVWVQQALHTALPLETARSLVGLTQASVALCTVGRRFYRSSYQALCAGFANMDVLVALGATTSFLFSGAAMILGTCHVMFDTIPMLLAFQLCGRYIQLRAERASTAAVDKLISARPSRVQLVLGNAADLPTCCNISAAGIVEVEEGLLRPGDVVLVGAGQIIPCDGVILSCPSPTAAFSPAAASSTSDTPVPGWNQTTAFVDESMLTGESRRVPKRSGDLVSAGTTVIGHSDGGGAGSVLVRAMRVGSNSTLAQIVETVQSSYLTLQASSTLGQVDRLAAQMVPAVVAFAALTFASWWLAAVFGWVGTSYFGGHQLPAGLQALMFATSSVMVSCPCALGLASPLAVVIAMDAGARQGVLMTSAHTLETAGAITHIIFDKTGTLTQGSPSVSQRILLPVTGEPAGMDSSACGEVSGEELKMWEDIARAEHGVSHPIALALRTHAAAVLGAWATRSESEDKSRSRALDLVHEGAAAEGSVDEIIGQGVVCASSEGDIAVGSERLMAGLEAVGHTACDENGIGGALQTALEAAETWERSGSSVVWVARRPSPGEAWVRRMAIAVSDPLRPEARVVVSELQRRGLSVGILSGDSQGCVDGVLMALQLDSMQGIGGLSPEGKRDAVAGLQRWGSLRWGQVPGAVGESVAIGNGVSTGIRGQRRACVAMVGDGVNDALALTQSEMAVAFGARSSVAMQAADVVLLQHNLSGVLRCLDLCRVTVGTISCNLGWALGYNIVALPVAAGMLAVPMGVVLPPWICSGMMSASTLAVIASSLSIIVRTGTARTPGRRR